MARNYAKETKWEDSPKQVKRREARNAVEAAWKKKHQGRSLKATGKELDHQGYHPTGSLRNVPVKLVSRHRNRVRQPPHKGYK